MPTGLKTRVHRTLTRYAMLAACAIFAHAQAPSTVVLNVMALDGKGHPVTDLTAADFQIFDDGKARQIASFNASATEPRAAARSTTLILFDLLNSIPRQREYTSTLLIRALEPLETGDSVYLYLLTNHGDIYPVHALPPPSILQAGETNQDGKPPAAPWTRQIHPLLDRAIQNVFGFRPVDDKDGGVRSAVTFKSLGEVGGQLGQIPGPKTIVWITRGASNWLHYPYGCQDVTLADRSGSYLAGKCGHDCAKWSDNKCIDYTPFLRHFSTELDRTNTMIYSVEETADGALPPADRGSAKDTLQQLADLTGGRMYSGGDVEKAIAQSLEDIHARYQLTMEAPAPDGKYHKVRVACTRKGVRILAQRGYYADQP